MRLENLDKYLEATQYRLGVEGENYGGGFRAIVCPDGAVDFLFGNLNGDDLAGTQTQFFFADNALFPDAWGKTPSDALERLDRKLGVLYAFVPREGVYAWDAVPQFELKAEYDCAPGEPQSHYQVSWGDIVDDLRRTASPYFYDDAKEHSGPRDRRNLRALVQFKYEGDFCRRLTEAMADTP